MAARLLVVLMVLAMLLAGCVSAPRPPFSTRDIETTDPDVGPGGRPLAVHVRTENGAVAANVALWWTVREEVYEKGREVHAQGIRIQAPTGDAQARVPAGKAIHVAASAGDALTEEWILDAVPPGSGPASVEVRLYEIERTLAWAGVWDEAATVGVWAWPYHTKVEWSPTTPPFSADPTWNEGYLRRVFDVEGVMQWENTPFHAGDLGVLVQGEGAAEACFLEDDDRDLEPGPHEQAFTALLFSERCTFFLIPESRQPLWDPIQIGPATDSHMVGGLGGLPFTMAADVQLYPWNGWQGHIEELRGTRLSIQWLGPDPEPRAAAPETTGPARDAAPRPPPAPATSTPTTAADPSPRPSSALGPAPPPAGTPQDQPPTDRPAPAALLPALLAAVGLALVARLRRMQA